MDIIEIIKNHYDKLTKKQREIAGYLIENPADICYISIAGLSERMNCAPVTILKFCKAIGFPNFIELKKEFREYNQSLINKFSVSSYNVPSEIIKNNSQFPYLETLCNEQLNIIKDFYNQLDLNNIWNIAQILSEKKVIYLFAHDASKTLAMFLQSRLSILNMNIVLTDLSEMKQVEYVISQMTPDDASIVFSYPNYYYSVSSVARHINSKGCELFLLADSPECPAVPFANYAILCKTRTKIFHNSWILPMIALNLLTSTLAMVTEGK